MWLCDPDEQKANPGKVPDAEVPQPPKIKLDLDDCNQKGSPWIVVGGDVEGKKGLIVRRGESLDSPAYPYKLAPGAKIIAEAPVKGKRLHYMKVDGDGPEIGWISIVMNGKILCKPDVPKGYELTEDI